MPRKYVITSKTLAGAPQYTLRIKEWKTDAVADANTFVFKPSDQLQPYFTPVATKDKELVAYCFIGQTASVVYMAGRILGYNMKLYDGSIQEWSRIKDLPMEKTEKK